MISRRALSVLVGLTLIAALAPAAAPATAAEGGNVIQPFPATQNFSDPEKTQLNKAWSGKPYDFVPPYPGMIVQHQPDGSAFKAVLPGAEVGGRLETPSGHTIVRNHQGWWVYADKGPEGLVPTARRVGLEQPGNLPNHLGRTQALYIDPSNGADIRTQLFEYFRSQSVARTQAAQADGEKTVYKIPALMLQTNGEFADDSTAENLKNFLSGFGTNPNGTVTEFYLEMSYGQMLAEVDVYGPYRSIPSQADPCHYGGITVAGEGHYESPQNELTNGMVVGVGGGGAAGMAAEVVPQADPEVDFSQYDNNDDGYVDLVFIIHSGPDMAATGNPCDTWSHAISLQPVVEGVSPTPAGIPTNDGVFVANMNTVPEVGLNVGVVSHEMSHNLGEPDFYDTSYKSQGTGDWDNMAGGAWFGDPPGTNPIHFNPLVKLAQAWVQPKIIESTTTNLALRPWEVYPELAMIPLKRGDDPGTDEEETDAIIEAFLLHNSSRTAHGPRNWGTPLDGPDQPALFDRLLLNSGLITWHMDRTSPTNNNSARYRLDLEEFDYLDTDQELALNHTRGEPTDPYFDTATGLSTATRSGIGGAPSPSQTFSGTAPPSFGNAVPFTFEWTVPENPANQLMEVKETCKTEGGDWDLYVDEFQNGEWVEVGSGATGACSESATIVQPRPGNYRVRIYNWLATDVPGGFDGEISYKTAEVFGRADTYNNDGSPTGWTIGNVRPTADGLQLSSEVKGAQSIQVDLIKDARADVSPGFLSTGSALLSGNTGTVKSEVFNNGGAPAAGVVATLYEGTQVIRTVNVGTLGSGAAKPVSFSYLPSTEGLHSLRVAVTTSSAESSTANNSQTTELGVYARNARTGVLVVDDDGGFATEQSYEAALTSLGVPFATTGRHPAAAEMSKYKAVLWESGLERMSGQLSRDDVSNLKSYLDGGGRLWISSPRLAAGLAADSESVTGSLNPGVDPAFGHDYFGIGYKDTVQRGGGVAVPMNVNYFDRVYAFRPFTGRPLQDIPSVTNSQVGTVEQIFEWRQDNQTVGPLGTLVKGDGAHGNFRSVFTGFNLSGVTSATAQRDLVDRTLDLLGVQPSGYAPNAPVTHHTPIRSALRGEQLEVAVVLGGATATAVELQYRKLGASWTTKTMKAQTGGLYTYALPATVVQTPGLEYRIIVTIGTTKLREPGNSNFGYWISVPLGASSPNLPY